MIKSELQKLLLEQKQQVEEQLREYKKEDRTVSEDSRSEEVDFSKEHSDRNVINLLQFRLTKKLEYLNEALARLESSTFGICTICQEPIGLKRLEANLQCHTCINCQREIEAIQKTKIRWAG